MMTRKNLSLNIVIVDKGMIADIAFQISIVIILMLTLC
jgi:hypothetical protein